MVLLYLFLHHHFTFSYDGYSEVSKYNTQTYKPILCVKSNDKPYRLAYYYGAKEDSINYLIFCKEEKLGMER